jgi:hypothetical protein
VAETGDSFAHLILNPAAGGAAAYLSGLSKTAREGGIRVSVLEPGEDMRHAALAAAEDGARVLGVAVEHGIPLVVARDLGLDLARPLNALDAFYAGRERRASGRVNQNTQPPGPRCRAVITEGGTQMNLSCQGFDRLDELSA